MVGNPRFSTEPEDAARFTREWDRTYTKFAHSYDLVVGSLPVWKTWIRCALPHIVGPRVLEISFGTGYLISQYANEFETHGLDYNWKLVTIARHNLARARQRAELVQGNVEAMPYPDDIFDCVVNTMAFSGYPNGLRALAEMKRVLRIGGKLVLIDIGFPPDRNWLGTSVAKLWQRAGDIVRDMATLFSDCGLDFSDESIGAWGSVRLYVATKRTGSETPLQVR